MVYDNLKEKLKFFQPAFHSTTPEGLNTRLTFLNQCMRPGDTIPTIKDVGGTQQVQYNNATNTAFGAPPVLILRVGDFYNTKIIPTSLQFQYEQLDIENSYYHWQGGEKFKNNDKVNCITLLSDNHKVMNTNIKNVYNYLLNTNQIKPILYP